MATCPFCEIESETVWAYRHAQAIYQCSSCKVLFFDRATMSKRDYQTYYPYLADWDDKRFEYEYIIRQKKFSRELKELEQFSVGRNLVDIGAGPGYFCRAAREAGFNAIGVEASTDAMEAGRKHFGVDYTTLEELAPNSLDVVSCSHVLEHIEEPRYFLQHLHTLLKPNGILFVKVPHCLPLSFALKNRLRKLVNSKTENTYGLYLPEHPSGFYPEALTNCLKPFGFCSIKVLSCSMWSSYYDPMIELEVLNRGYLSAARCAVRGAIDTVGALANKGDWIVGFYRKLPDET